MDKRFVLGIVVSFLFVMLWFSFVQPRFFPKPPAPPPTDATETRKIERGPETAPVAERASRPVVDDALLEKPVLENDDLKLTFSNRGAVLVSAELKKFKKKAETEARLDLLHHYEGLAHAFELRDATDPTAWLEQRLWRVERPEGSGVLVFVLEPGMSGFAGSYGVRKEIRLAPTGMHADIRLRLDYKESGSIEKRCRFTPSGGVALDSDVQGTHDLTGAESVVFQADAEGDRLEHATPLDMGKIELKSGEEPSRKLALNGRKRFVADLNSYFGVYCALEQMPARMEAVFVGNIDPASDQKNARVTRTRVDLEFPMVAEKDKPAEHRMILYFGPNESRFLAEILPKDLKSWGDEFSRVYSNALGFFSWISQGVLFLLRFFERVTGNWGVAIMLLTLFVRVCLFPINRKSQIAMVRHSEAMARIKPRLDVLKEKYKSDAKRFLAEQQALLKSEKVPLVPLGGCLPVVLQIPIFYGLFAALRASIELRQAPFLWAADLSQPDHLVRFAEPMKNPLAGMCCCAPPGMADTISGINLLPILMTIAWFVNQLLMPKPANEDPQLAQQRKMMMFLPIVFGFMMYGYGAGLSLYWLTSSLLGIVESRLIKKWLPPRKAVVAAA